MDTYTIVSSLVIEASRMKSDIERVQDALVEELISDNDVAILVFLRDNKQEQLAINFIIELHDDKALVEREAKMLLHMLS